MQSNIAEPIITQHQSEIPKQGSGSDYREIQHWAKVLHWKKDDNPQSTANQKLSKFAQNFDEFVNGIQSENKDAPLNFKTMDTTLKSWLESPLLSYQLRNRTEVLDKLKAEGAVNAEKILTLYEYEDLKFDLSRPEYAKLRKAEYSAGRMSVGEKLSYLYSKFHDPKFVDNAISLDKHMELIDDQVMSRFVELFDYQFSLKDLDSYVPLLRALNNAPDEKYNAVFAELQNYKFLLPSVYLSRFNGSSGKDCVSQAKTRYLNLLTGILDEGGITDEQKKRFVIFERSHSFSKANLVFDSGVFTDEEADKLVNQQLLFGAIFENPKNIYDNEGRNSTDADRTAQERLDYFMRSDVIKQLEKEVYPNVLANLVEYASYGGDHDLIQFQMEFNSKRIAVCPRGGYLATQKLSAVKPFIDLGYLEQVREYFPNHFLSQTTPIDLEKDMEYFARSVFIVENLSFETQERNELMKVIYRPGRVFRGDESDGVVDYVFSQLYGKVGSGITDDTKNNWKFLFRVNAKHTAVLKDSFQKSGVTQKYFSYSTLQEIIGELWDRQSNIDISEFLNAADLAALTDSQRDFWTLYKKLDREHRGLIRLFSTDVNSLKAEDVGRVEELFHAKQYLNETNSKELRQAYYQLSLLLMDSDEPFQKAKEIRSIFERNNLPQIATAFKVFELLYPPEKIDKILSGKYILSPVLKNAGPMRRSMILYKDLLRIHILSGNPSLKAYLEAMRDGSSVLHKYDQVGYNGLPELEQAQLRRFTTRAERLFNASLFSRIHDETLLNQVDIDKQISMLRSRFQLAEGQTIQNRIEQMFLKPLGFSSIDEALSIMDATVVEANSRDKEFVMEFRVGDLVKGVNLENLDAILKTGIVAREFLGADSGSDSTPFDADFIRLDYKSATLSLKSFVSSTRAKGYGNILLVIKDRGQFQLNDRQENGPKMSEDKYELFYSGVVGDNHYGVRTGLPSTQIDGIILTDNDDVLNREQLSMTVALNGVYIPIYDSEGELIYTKDDFDKYSLASSEVHQALTNSSLVPKDLIGALKKTDYIKNLYEESAGVWEGYSLEEHSLMVLEQFKKYFFDTFSSPIISRDGFALMLALHDIGKPLAARIKQDTKQQHKYGLKFIPHLAGGLGLSTYESELVTVLANQDVLGSFIQNQISLEQAGALVRDKAKEVGVPVQDFFDLLKTYYMCDASAYTLDAGGKNLLDFLFDVGDGKIKLKHQYQRQLDELEPYIYIED